MFLKLKKSFLSIVEFPDIALPKFTLITGVNGTGKTHLLKAIKEGSVDAGVKLNKISFYHLGNLVPNEPPAIDGHQFKTQADGLYQSYKKNLPKSLERIVEVARTSGVTGDILSDPVALTRLTREELASHLSGSNDVEVAYAAISNAVNKASSSILSSFGNEGMRHRVEKYVADAQLTALDLHQEDFSVAVLPSVNEGELFQQSFAQYFVWYRDFLLENDLRARRKEKTGEDIHFLSEDKIRQQYGDPPWEIANSVFSAASLNFEIDCPDLHSYAPYKPILTKKQAGVEVKFNDLSSGEKILMSFAFCLFNTQRNSQDKMFDLLLLDEIDAPLHPSMANGLMRIIEDVFVKKYGVHVIFTTHSPTTVALAPDEALYVMKLGRPGLHKISKAEALNTLTVGVPTLAISYDARRRVFVESSIDARLHAKIYQLVKSKFLSERSLEFIETGVKLENGGEANVGCEVVRSLVNKLSGLGNTSVFGLVDWDGVNSESDRLKVLAIGRRNGLENILFDPLPLAAALLRDCSDYVKEIFPPQITYRALGDLSDDILQEVVSRIASRVLDSGDASEVIACHYLGGRVLNIPKLYLTMDDHKLETRVFESFPPLKGVQKLHGRLTIHIVNSVFADYSDFIPMDLIQTYTLLLEAPSHA